MNDGVVMASDSGSRMGATKSAQLRQDTVIVASYTPVTSPDVLHQVAC